MSAEVPIIILILGIPIYFLLSWVLKKYKIDSKSRVRTSIIGAIFLAPILYLILVFLFFSYLFYEPKYEFNKQKWFADKSARFEMRDDIVESELLKNKNKIQIIELIGKPEKEISDVWTYELGISGAGFGWQFNSLQLTFTNGKVSDVKKYEIVD